MSILGSIIGPAIGALGSVLGGRKTTKSSVDYVALRKNAEKAGFNPLTALQNGGSAGFARVSGPPALSSTEAIANVLGTAADTWFNRDKVAADAEKEALELALMRQELANLQKPSEVVRDRDFGYSIPQVTTSTGSAHDAPSPPLASRLPVSSGSPVLHGPVNGSDGLTVAGQKWERVTQTSPASDWSDEYGDVAESIIGLPKLVFDTGYNAANYAANLYRDLRFKREVMASVPKRPKPPLPPLASDVAPPRQDEWFKHVPTYQ